ncbi:hypothetical protein DYBT9623_04226 [Dyadobacter sp. CECT 9623]|uniref:DUF6916 domain-containing protein n=1 Tax=Dyadobacter linearis TaxID=2823330 RepID=A0ABN7RBW4_9BACT|nr:hypothetical protein [Dyadobacter sp. CECT 9623]CAG5072645.1 hypothetical protein DYBT9623_04226 [Dyadobacter sp. CECT 9623]
MEAYDLSTITADDFSKYMNQTFDVYFAETQIVPSALTRVTRLSSYTPLERGPFSLELQTSGDHAPRPQGIYRIAHPEIGNIEVFLVPVGTDVKGMRYEAVFS